MTKWNAPALGEVLAKITSLALRAERLRLATKVKASERTLELLTRKPEQ